VVRTSAIMVFSTSGGSGGSLPIFSTGSAAACPGAAFTSLVTASSPMASQARG
jgi:hypothetical protein